MSEQQLIIHYNNYRDFLHDWFWSAKLTNQKISFRYVSKQLKLKSPNHFHLVINKKRHLSKQNFLKILRLINLKTKEVEYLKLLYQGEFEKSVEERANILAKLERIKKQIGFTSFPVEKYDLLTNNLAWYIKIAAKRLDGRPLTEVTKMIVDSNRFNIDEKAAYSALATLQHLGYLRVEDGCCLFERGDLRTEWDMDRAEIKAFHLANLNAAAKSIAWPIDQRYFSNVSFPCNRELYDRVKQEIRELSARILELTGQYVIDPGDCQKVVSLEFSMVPFLDFQDE